MILRFKPESEAEKAVKELIAHRNKTEEYAKDIVENAIGIRPFGFGYTWFFSVSYSWSCNMTGFDQSAPKEIEGMTFVNEQTDGLRVYKPNKRNKKGKLIADSFHKEQCELRTDSESLNQFGIFTEKDMRYTNFEIGEDDAGVWMAISNLTFSWLVPHPDVFLETDIKTIPANA